MLQVLRGDYVLISAQIVCRRDAGDLFPPNHKLPLPSDPRP